MILNAIGDTPLVELQHIVPTGSARVFAKLESANPTGSMKDRMARSVVQAAAADGRLPQGGTIVEYTAGTTGISLAFVCAAQGYRARMVMSDAFSAEKRQTIEAFGAEVVIVPSDQKRITESLIKAMIERAREISREPDTFWTDQLNNADAITGYYDLGAEIWTQTGGQIDAFVHSVGTAHSIVGVSQILKRGAPEIEIVAVEPAESAVLSGEPSGAHRIEGIGIGFLPPLWQPAAVTSIMKVSSQDAQEMARRLAREEGVFAGTSSGANVVAALQVAERLGADATVVTLIVDSGFRYLSTDVFRSARAPSSST
ncbi:MAG: PLP-dependent cysteine synthase family protein [Gemmatimonadota bacterium]